jgi:hypothetical protein
VVDALSKIPKLFEDMVGIIEIAKSIEANGSKNKQFGQHLTIK